MFKSQGLYNRAKEIIPGGTQLLSKRPEIFLPDQWPSYFKKAKGVAIWDLDDRKYLDMGIMAIGASPLGYANPYVSKAVKKAINKGCISSLNSYEEIQLAEKLIELHPHTEMVRFSRTGGEADAIAVRIARAASGKAKVAVCGYHGWHDWYLATNIGDSNNLKDLLLPGLSPVGVPTELKGTTLPFHYGNIDELQSIVADCGKELGVIVVEVQRYKEANVPFLKKVREIANKLNAVLIFDEVSSSFRQTIGAIYKMYDLEPDIVVLGKALGNGHPISAILGKRNVMEAAQDSFISSSYWTERVGFVAALETIDQFEINNVVEYLRELGNYLDAGFQKIFHELKLSIKNIGMKPVPVLDIQEENSLLIKTIFTQEMLKKRFLVSNIIYLSYAHNKKIIDLYLDAAYNVFLKIKSGLEKGNLNEQLRGAICHSGFSRLT
jgi:glutamate-1-semialdehyde aminotransferase